ncbi:hydroxyisourate hydrolase [Streptomyces sp. NPDC020965]|uniref:hydroxyisourate hydrolase n=1 Tax=Streptomyces sp. NPDC020965 TaxID=3365105 RepID=UPI00378E1A4D
MSTEPTTSVSTHVLDTAIGRPAGGVTVSLSARAGTDAPWVPLGDATTDPDGRCAELPALPDGTTRARLDFGTGAYLAPDLHPGDRPVAGTAPDPDAFFPEVSITFAVVPGEHYHVPLLLSPFGYSVYRGS